MGTRETAHCGRSAGQRRGLTDLPALFARAGATPAAHQSLAEAGGLLIDLPALFSDLTEASERGVESREPRRVRAWALVRLHSFYSDDEP